MPGTGVELSSAKHSETHMSPPGGAKCGALFDRNDPELARLTAIWPTPPGRVKTKIMDLIDKHTTEGEADGSKTKKG